MGVQILELPNILNLTEKSHEKFPFKKTFEAAKDEPFVVLHTSGTTELPKPIVWTHDYIATATQRNETPAGYVNQMELYTGYVIDDNWILCFQANFELEFVSLIHFQVSM